MNEAIKIKAKAFGAEPAKIPHGFPAEVKRGLDAYIAKRPEMQGPTGWRPRKQRGLDK